MDDACLLGGADLLRRGIRLWPPVQLSEARHLLHRRLERPQYPPGNPGPPDVHLHSVHLARHYDREFERELVHRVDHLELQHLEVHQRDHLEPLDLLHLDGGPSRRRFHQRDPDHAREHHKRLKRILLQALRELRPALLPRLQLLHLRILFLSP